MYWSSQLPRARFGLLCAVRGMPLHTLVRGRFVMRDGQLVADAAGWGRSVKALQRMPAAKPRNRDLYTRAIVQAPAQAAPSTPAAGAQDGLWGDDGWAR